ncbi:MAG: hypothetical protein ACE5HE_04845 [Phycisphaerae bacterium]
MYNRSMPILWWTAPLLAAALPGGCHKPRAGTTSTIPDGRLEELAELMAAQEMQGASALDPPAAVDTMREELRARYEQELRETLKKIEQAYLQDQDAWLECEPIRKEQVRTIWDTRPEEVP